MRLLAWFNRQIAHSSPAAGRPFSKVSLEWPRGQAAHVNPLVLMGLLRD